MSRSATVGFGNRAYTATLTASNSTPAVGETVTLTLVCADRWGQALTRRPVSWDTTQGGIVDVTVAEDGLSATALVLAAGSTSVVASLPGGASASAAIAIGGEPAGNTAPHLVVNGVEAATADMTVEAGVAVTLDLTGTYDAEGAWGYAVDWGDGTIANHTDPGDALFDNFAGFNPLTHTYASVGTATLVVTAADAWGRATSQTIAVSIVSPNAAPASVDLNYPTASLTVGQSLQLVPTARDAGGGILNDCTFSYSSDTPADATVSSGGLVTAVAAGGAVITVTATNSQGSAQGTSTITVSAASSSYANEPAGLTRIAETNFSAIPAYGSTIQGISGDGGSGEFKIASTARSGMTVVTDATAPGSPSSVMRYTWPNGLGDGASGIGYFLLWSTGNLSGTGDQRDEVFVAYRVRYNGTESDPANTGTDFENQGTGSKLFYIPYANSSRENHSYLMLNGDSKTPSTAPNGTIASSFKLTWWITEMNADGSDPGHSSRHDQNVTSTKFFTIGGWHLLELYMRMNDIGSANGAAKLWVDGNQTHDLSGLTFRSAANPKGIYRFHHDGVWGGDIGQVRNRDDYTLLDHVYVSAA